jgi:Fur family zinc uptake transcriptional regulator
MGENLKAASAELTPLRREVLALIQAAEKPIKAYELLSVLSARCGPTAPPTIYRTLNYLLEQGHIHRIACLNAYAACAHAPAATDHVFLICEACGDAEEVACEGARTALVDVGAGRGFQAVQVTMEVRGACADCGACRKSVLKQSVDP